MQKELFSLFGNGRRENFIFTLNSGEFVTCHFKASGVSTNINKYYDLKSEAKKVAIIVNKAASLTHIGNQELKFPRTIPTGGLVHKDGIEWDKITVRADQDATTFEIYAS
jgi:hypothetical protein